MKDDEPVGGGKLPAMHLHEPFEAETAGELGCFQDRIETFLVEIVQVNLVPQRFQLFPGARGKGQIVASRPRVAENLQNFHLVNLD